MSDKKILEAASAASVPPSIEELGVQRRSTNFLTLTGCFVCGKHLQRVNGNEMQPWGGVYCETSGNFGSTVIDCERTAFLVCDECLADRLSRTLRVFVKQIRPVFVYRPWGQDG